MNTGYSPPRHVVRNGRLVPAEDRLLSLDWGRCCIVLSICCALWLSNPANQYSPSVLQSRGFTNYGFFSVQDRGDALRFYAATQQADCQYNPRVGQLDDENELAFLYHHTCLQFQKLLAHERPLLWDPVHHDHTVHRILTWTVVCLALIKVCRLDRTALPFARRTKKHLWRNALLSILWPENVLWSLWQANVYLFPVWQLMTNTVSLQHPRSWFHVVEHTGTNVYLSALCLLALSVVVNAASMYYTGEYLLRGLDGLIATGFGYYRAIYQGYAAPELQWWRNALLLRNAQWLPDVTSISLTWFLFLQVLTQRSVPGLVAFVLANLLGYGMGDYSRNNMSSLASFEKLWQDLMQGISSMFYW